MSGYWYSKLAPSGSAEGTEHSINGMAYLVKDGMLRQKALLSESQKQTQGTFSFKWSKKETYETEAFHSFTADWMTRKYLGGDRAMLDRLLPAGRKTNVLDIGVGAGVSTLCLFGDHLKRANYVGIDISDAADQAKRRFGERGLTDAEFIQADANKLPFSEPEFDLIFSEGVLHHTDSTEKAFKSVARLLRPGGTVMFYVYSKKAPIREFCDDYIREAIAPLSDEQAWNALLPLSRFGDALGRLNVEVDVPESIDFLQIPAGRINIQRLFYYHIFKAFYHPDWTIEEVNRNSFDWYRPKNCHRHSPEEVRGWCEESGLEVVRMEVEPSGITTLATRK